MRDTEHLKSLVESGMAKFHRRHGDINMGTLDYLTASMKICAQTHEKLCAAAGIKLLIYCTIRPNAEQDKLYAQGRTTPGKKVTNAKAGQSPHNPDKDGRAHAYDCVPMLNGKPVWGTTSVGDAALWEKVGTLGETAGLKWSGRWKGEMREMAHFQDPEWVKPV